MQNGKLDRTDGPSIEFKNNIRWWMKNGKLHRDNGPAIIDENDMFKYWINGNLASDEEIKNIKRNQNIDNLI
jgi:hypothetical protein